MPDNGTQVEIATQFAREEQREITLTKKTTQSIDRLKEYRSALITAAVTGQIDVTSWTKSGTNDHQLDAQAELQA